MLSPIEWQKAIEFSHTEGVSCHDPLSSICCFEDGFLGKGGCTAGIAGAAITANLDVLPCVRLRKPVGNLQHESLEAIWVNSASLRKYRNRHQLIGCKDCELIVACGGCRAAALWATGSEFEMDPQCWWMAK
jgi:radical SAM protein with 4Fe4S-binding SPASM domain